MRRPLSLRNVAVVFVGIMLTGACAGACGQSRRSFDTTSGLFEPDASADGGECLFQCSLDGRSVIDTCTRAIVETCPPERACGAGACQEPCAAATAERSSNGCEFYLQPPLFTKSSGRGCYAAYVVNTSTLPVDVSLELEGKSLDVSKSLYRTNPGDPTLLPHVGPIAPDESAVLFVFDAPPEQADRMPCPDGVVAATAIDPVPEGTGIGSSFHLVTSAPVGLAAIYPFGGAPTFLPSATLLLPAPTWGKQHVIVNAWERITVQIAAGGGWPAAQIVASEDDTEVTIVPTHTIQDGAGVVGKLAHVPATYRLRKGQFLQLHQAEELSGSIVTSNKPASVFGGHECMFIPSSRWACDMALQQLPAFEQWGSEYVGVGYRPRLGDEHEPMPYRIVAARDGTRLDYDPAVPAGAPIALSAGEVATFWAGTGDPFVVRTQDADHPIYVAAYMSGGGYPMVEDFLGDRDFEGNGDPAFVNVVPSGQYLSSYSFFADPTYEETSLVVVREKDGGEFNDVWLECAGNLTDFRPIGTRGKYEYTRVDLIRHFGPGQSFGTGVCRSGLQRMRSDGPFTATLWGWGQYASYAYPGGMAQRKLVRTPLPPPVN
jgi:IgGFc binding protein